MMISEMMESNVFDFCYMEKVRVPDGQSGFYTDWKEGAKFSAIQRHDTTILARQAEAQDTASTFTFLVDKSIPLEFPDVIKRLSDGQVFQITSSSNDSKTPATSNLNMAMVTAKKWRLPT